MERFQTLPDPEADSHRLNDHRGIEVLMVTAPISGSSGQLAVVVVSPGTERRLADAARVVAFKSKS